MREGKGKKMGFVSTVLYRIEGKTFLMRWHLSSDLSDGMRGSNLGKNIQVRRPKRVFKKHVDYSGWGAGGEHVMCDYSRVRKVKKGNSKLESFICHVLCNAVAIKVNETYSLPSRNRGSRCCNIRR